MTQHTAYKTTICRHLECNYTLHQTEHQYVLSFQSVSNSNSPRQVSLQYLSTFKWFTLSTQENHAIIIQVHILLYCFNVICRLSLIYNYFNTNLYLIYSLQYQLWALIHKQSFHDNSTISRDVLSMTSHQEDSSATIISRSHKCNISDSFNKKYVKGFMINVLLVQ